MTKAITEIFYHQTTRHREIRTLANSNQKMRKELEVLKSTLAQTQANTECLEDAWKKRLEDATEKLKRELQDEKSAKEKLKLDHAAEKKKTDSQLKGLTDRVTKLEREAKDAADALPAIINKAEERGSVNFMKAFLENIDDFNWYRLGDETGDFAEALKKEMEEDAANGAP